MYFTDENTLGLGKLLVRTGRDDVVYPGHPALPGVPLGTPDLEWMPVAAAHSMIVLTRERRLRTRPIELAVYREHGIRSVRIGNKRDLSPQDQLEMFLRHERRIELLTIKLGRGPWALLLNDRGVSEIRLRTNP